MVRRGKGLNMKLNAGKRILMFFHWLLSLIICAAFAVYIIKPDWAMQVYNRLAEPFSATQMTIIGIAALAIYVILSVVQGCIIFHRGKRSERGFITVDSSDSGRVRIAVSAIEQMVRQSVTSIDGITDMRIGIDSQDDAIAIRIAAVLQSGCHVPTITVNMQRSIRQFVEMNCGVAVRSVSISINAVSAAGEGGRRRGRRRDEIKPVETPAPSYAPDIPAEPVTLVEEPVPSIPEPEPLEAEASEPEILPEPEPIRLHFDHLPQPEADQASEESEAPEEMEEE